MEEFGGSPDQPRCIPSYTSAQILEAICLSPEAMCLREFGDMNIMHACMHACMHVASAQVHEASDDADWRHARISTQQFIQRQFETGRRISPICIIFGVETYLFRIDWLHAVDAGVGADLAGNVFEALLHKFPGNAIKARCQALNEELQMLYKRNDTEDRLKYFSNLSFKRPNPTCRIERICCSAEGCDPLRRESYSLAV